MASHPSRDPGAVVINGAYTISMQDETRQGVEGYFAWIEPPFKEEGFEQLRTAGAEAAEFVKRSSGAGYDGVFFAHTTACDFVTGPSGPSDGKSPSSMSSIVLRTAVSRKMLEVLTAEGTRS